MTKVGVGTSTTSELTAVASVTEVAASTVGRNVEGGTGVAVANSCRVGVGVGVGG